MRFLTYISLALAIGSSAAEAKKKHKCPKYFSNHPIFTPPQGSKAVYPRVAELADGTILATISWRDPDVELPYFPVFASKDKGWTWKHISNITDDVRLIADASNEVEN